MYDRARILIHRIRVFVWLVKDKFKRKLIARLLKWAGYFPGKVIVEGDRKYIIDLDGARRRLRRD